MMSDNPRSEKQTIDATGKIAHSSQEPKHGSAILYRNDCNSSLVALVRLFRVQIPGEGYVKLPLQVASKPYGW